MTYQAQHKDGEPIAPPRSAGAIAADDLIEHVDKHAPHLAAELLAMSKREPIPENAYYWDLEAIAGDDDPQGEAIRRAKLILWRHIEIKPL